MNLTVKVAEIKVPFFWKVHKRNKMITWYRIVNILWLYLLNWFLQIQLTPVIVNPVIVNFRLEWTKNSWSLQKAYHFNTKLSGYSELRLWWTLVIVNHFCRSVHRFHSVYSELFTKEEAKLIEKRKFAAIFFEIFHHDYNLSDDWCFTIFFEL